MSVDVLYINNANYLDKKIIKVGVTNNWLKRVREFNCGVNHRAMRNKDLVGVVFKPAFCFCFEDRAYAIKAERWFLKTFKDLILPEFGREVLSMSEFVAKKHIDKNSSMLGLL